MSKEGKVVSISVREEGWNQDQRSAGRGESERR